MIRAVLILGCLATPAAAQNYGLPPVLAPCGENHMVADRYRADLVDLGWIFVPTSARAVQLDLLNETFVALVSGTDGPRAERLAQSRALWADLGRSQLVFTTSENAEALMVSGGVNSLGEAQVRCWMAFADGTRLDTLYDQLLEQADGAPEAGEEEVVFLTRTDPETEETLRMYLTRPTPDTDTPATRAGMASLLAVGQEALE